MFLLLLLLLLKLNGRKVCVYGEDKQTVTTTTFLVTLHTLARPHPTPLTPACSHIVILILVVFAQQ